MDIMIPAEIEMDVAVTAETMSQPVDMLGRDKFVEKVITLVETLSEKKSSCCFAIDGAWGSGKSFVLNMIQKQLGEYCSETAAGDKYLILPYNCWEYDYYEEPVVAIIASMKDSIEAQAKLISSEAGDVAKAGFKIVKDIISKTAGRLAKNMIGVDPVSIAQELRSEAKEAKTEAHQFDAMFSFKKTLDETRESLKELAKDQTVLLIVDELDRCLPAYAIKVLERLHHLFFGIENIIVMIAVDSSQIENSVKQLYGEKVNVDRYLRKFIDFTMTLDNGEISKKFEDKYRDYLDCFICKQSEDLDFLNELYEKMYADLPMRTQEKLINNAKTIHQICGNGEKYDISLLGYELLFVILVYYTAERDIRWFIDGNIKRKLNSDGKTNFLSDMRKSFLESRQTKMGLEGTYKNYLIYDKFINRIFVMILRLYIDDDNYYKADRYEFRFSYDAYRVEFELADNFYRFLSLVDLGKEN